MYSLVKRRALIEEEERVDEIECKVFIKRSDSNLLWICREPALWDGLVLRGYDTHEEAEEFTLKLDESPTCSVGQTFNRLSREGERKEQGERDRESNQSSP